MEEHPNANRQSASPFLTASSNPNPVPINHQSDSDLTHPLASRDKPKKPPLEFPGPNSSPSDWQVFRQAVLNGGKPQSALASRNFPSTAPFKLPGFETSTELHVALNEIFIPCEDQSPEIVEISPARDLTDLSKKAAEISPLAELILYHPDAPRAPEYMRILGKELLIHGRDEAEVRGYAENRGWKVLSSLESGSGTVLVETSSPQQALAELKQSGSGPFIISPNFRQVGFKKNLPPLSMATKKFAPTDPLYKSQWYFGGTNVVNGITNLLNVNLSGAWDLAQGRGVVVGIVDDGVQLDHPDLAINAAPTGLHRNWNDGSTNNPAPTKADDEHGTAVAGVAAARANNGVGIAGAAPSANWAGLRLLAGPFKTSQEVQAFSFGSNSIAIKKTAGAAIPTTAQS